MRPSWSQIAVSFHFPVFLNSAAVVVISGIFLPFVGMSLVLYNRFQKILKLLKSCLRLRGRKGSLWQRSYGSKRLTG